MLRRLRSLPRGWTLRRRLAVSLMLLSLTACIVVWAMVNSPRMRSDLYAERGFWRFRQGQRDAALAEFERAVQADPDNAAAYSQRAVVYYQLGMLEAAAEDYTLLAERYPAVASVYEDRGVVYYDLGDYAAAIADFTHAIELKPSYAVLYLHRARAYEQSGDSDAAAADYARFLDLYGAQDSTTREARARLEALSSPAP